MILGLALLVGPVNADDDVATDAPCATRPTAVQVEAAAAELTLLRLAEHDVAVEAEAELREALRCTPELLSPEQARRVLRALRDQAPLAPFREAPGVSLLAAPGVVWVDGVRTSARPTSRPALVQITADPPELVRWSGVLGPDQELPAFRVSQAGVVVGPRRAVLGTPSRRLAAGSIAAFVVGGVALGYAVHARSRYLAQPVSDAPDPTWLRINRGSGTAGLVLVGTGAGLLTAAVLRGAW